MSMSTYITGIRPPDDEWKKMKAIWDSCKAANIDIPDEVDEFFDGECPDNAGITIDLTYSNCSSPYSNDCGEGFEIDVSKLPKNLTAIRFYNTW